MQPLLLLSLSIFLKGTWAALECPGSFEDISAADYVANLHPGWNVGNTLDAVPDEGSWNNPPVEAATFDQAKSAGFKSIRLPGLSPQWSRFLFIYLFFFFFMPCFNKLTVTD